MMWYLPLLPPLVEQSPSQIGIRTTLPCRCGVVDRVGDLLRAVVAVVDRDVDRELVELDRGRVHDLLVAVLVRVEVEDHERPAAGLAQGHEVFLAVGVDGRLLGRVGHPPRGVEVLDEVPRAVAVLHADGEDDRQELAAGEGAADRRRVGRHPELVDSEDPSERRVEVEVAARADALRRGRDHPAADGRGRLGVARGCAARIEQAAGDVRVRPGVALDPVGVRHRVHRALDVGVGPGRAAEALGEDRGARVRDRVDAVLRDALVGVGVAGLDDQRDAPDDRDHRQRGDDDDLAALAGAGACG